MDHIAVAERLASLPVTGRRIAPLHIGGIRIWLKDFDQPSPAKWQHVQQAVFAVTRARLLRPVPSLSGIEGAENEIAAMRAFREFGVRVPEVLWQKGARIAISDIGETIRDMQQRLGAPAIEAVTLLAARELSRIHASGLVHGRPILRNMTWDGKTVGFLDFEERPTDVMPAGTAQARDVVLLLMSLGRRCDDESPRAAFAVYASEIPPAVEDELRRVARVSGPLVGGLGRALARSGNRNIRGLHGALTALRGGFAARGQPA